MAPCHGTNPDGGFIVKLIASFVVAAALAATPALAQQNTLDLSSIKCKEFVTSGKDNIGMILMWLDGHYHDSDEPAVIDFKKMEERGQKLGAYCGQNPDHGLMTAAEKVFE
jgi:acid stress chaperone HdeB